ncbi:MAG: fibronectin type III domain-containing protein [Treponema sp.]|jgi:fibronectin type 3 domain-containing protein|nr:fibronectin type III domain-containing protein [Treponema sp.]
MKKGKKLLSAAGLLCVLVGILCIACPTSTGSGGGNGNDTPSKPSNLTAQVVSSTSIKIFWAAVSGASEYKIYRCATAEGNYNFLAETEKDNYTNSNLTPGTYYYKVSAINNDDIEGNQSEYVKAIISGTPSPTKVTAAGKSQTSITITWTTVSGAAQYTVYRCVTSTGVYQKVDSTEEGTYTDSGLTAASTYYYKVSAVSTDGTESPLSTYTVAATFDKNDKPVTPDDDGGGNGEDQPDTPAPALGAPYGLTAVGQSKSSIQVTWNAVTGASSYKISRSSSSTGTYTQTGTSTTTSYTDTGLTASTVYYYKVAAVNSGGDGPQSSAIKGETLASSGAIPEGYNLAEAIDYISAQVDNGTQYDITVDEDIFLDPHTIMTLGKNVTVYIHSPSADDIKTITLDSNGTLFTVDNSITLKLENITLKGRTANDSALVKVLLGGTLFIESGAAITGNMNTSGNGGGLYIDRGTVTMNGGTVSGNKAGNGAGVLITGKGAVFTLKGGEISANEARASGGGIFIDNNGITTMNGGVIKGNSSSSWYGGGVYIGTGTFNKIAGSGSTTSGTIYGSAAGNGLANTGNGAVINYHGSYIRNRTLGEFDEISTTNTSEGWD